MSQRAALLISTALTVLTMIGGLALAARLVAMDAADVPADTPAPVSDAVTTESEYEHAYVERLDAANRALELSQQQIAELTTRIQALEGQNGTLQEREQVYQARLAEASRRLEIQGQAALAAAPTIPADVPAPSSSSEEAAVAPPPVAPAEAPLAAMAEAPDADAAAVAPPASPPTESADALAAPVPPVVPPPVARAEPAHPPAPAAPVHVPAAVSAAPQARPAAAPTPAPLSLVPERPAKGRAPLITTASAQVVNILQLVAENRGAGVRSILPVVTTRHESGGRGKRGGRD
jgi:TolA-binding protein